MATVINSTFFKVSGSNTHGLYLFHCRRDSFCFCCWSLFFIVLRFYNSARSFIYLSTPLSQAIMQCPLMSLSPLSVTAAQSSTGNKTGERSQSSPTFPHVRHYYGGECPCREGRKDSYHKPFTTREINLQKCHAGKISKPTVLTIYLEIVTTSLPLTSNALFNMFR